MASSTTGERRWGSARRGGMTVLGKVAVPKPINLPSQRLENHGLDPSVEIVPKGSLSWGTRSSSSGSNAWGSSPRAEGGSGSPSHLSGRPSSSGGTRPSTAGSEKNHDTASNAWIANSRPSSASGILAANTTSLAALRPRSAETRPGSSQLSCFAEPLPEGTTARGASGAGDKLGIATSSSDGFSLSSGDFPTLGEEKVSGKNVESLDCNSRGGPGSSGPSTTTEKMEAAPDDDISHPTDVKSSMANSWEKDVPHPGMERWHGDSYPYPTHNIPPHPYENWRGGPPVNPPGQVWFRGPPGAPPYGTPPMAAPGGFPMEPFPYYCPQVPAPGLASSQTVPPHGGRPSGPPHSKNGDLCRPYMESYMRPGMPMRPGFYPGYYGQPMGFCCPNERDLSLMGRPSGPVFNKYPNRNAPEPTNSNARSCGGRTPEQVESGPPLDSRASVPVKQIKGWDKNSKEDRDRFGHKLTADAHPHDKGRAANASSQDNFWSEDPRKDKQMNIGKKSLHNEQAPFLIKDKTGFTDSALVKFHGNNNSAQSADVNHVVENVALPRDRTLIQKIEGLNAKVRASDGKHDFCREEPNGRGQAVNSNVSINEASANVHIEGHYPSEMLPVSHDRTILAEDKGFGSTAGSVATTITRHSSHNPQGRGVHGSKGRLNSQEADGWRKRSAISESQGIVSVVNSERTFSIQRREQHSTDMSSSKVEAKDNSKLSVLEPSIGQHVNMKEISKQRAIQLQKEEEERIREQKAKALAKLEELNRRSVNQGKETSRQKIDDVPSHPDGMQKQQESKIKIELQFGSFQSGEINITLASGYNPSKTSQGLESNVSSGVICSHTNQQLPQEHSVLSQKQSVPAIDDAQINDVAGYQNVHVYDTTREKGAGYKQKHNVQSGKSLSEKPIVHGKDKSSTTVAVLKEVNGKGVSSCSESNLRVDLPTVSDSLLHPKRKTNRAGKNKHMVDESFSASPAPLQKEFDVSRGAAESTKLVATEQKSHRNDTAVWAPVKSRTKMEVADENDQKSDEGADPSNRNDNMVPSSSKGRRAEIERYVPKAAIKGLAQQGSDQLFASPLIENSIPDGTNIQGRQSSPTTERPKRTVESRYVENKTKQWYQRNSTESNLVQASGDSLMSMTGPAKDSQTSDGAHQTQKPKEPLKGSVAKPVAQLEEVQPSIQDEHCGKQQLQSLEANEDNAVDGWVIYDEPVSYESAMVSGMEGNGKSIRGKKNPFLGHKGSRNHQNIDRESHTGGAKGDAEYFPETSQEEWPRSSKEYHMAQWQPKPQTHVINLHGNHARGRQTVTGEGDKIYKREGSKDTVKNMVQPQNYSSPDNGSYSPKENTVGNIESAPLGQTNVSNNEHRPSSTGNRWNGNYNGHFNRGREFHGDRSFVSKDSRHSHVPSHQEKQRQNSHYEYQPVGSYNRNKRGNNLEGQTENQHAGSKFKDRGQGSHSQRGGARFHGWQRVTNQTDAE